MRRSRIVVVLAIAGLVAASNLGDLRQASAVATPGSVERPADVFSTALHKPGVTSELEAHHPMVVRHPRNGRAALFANNLFTRSIDGGDEDESAAILSYLKLHAIRPEFICRWKWTPGDIAVWDNHYVQHYALGDYHPAPRKIHRVEILGHAPNGG